MDDAIEPNAPEESELALDRYLLQLWPAPAAPHAIICQTSQCAAYWHSVAQETAPPSAAQIAAHAEERNRPGRLGCAGPEDLVFTSPTGALLRNRNARSLWFDRAAVSAGLTGLTPHAPRHRSLLGQERT